jgi:cell division protein FtsQ
MHQSIGKKNKIIIYLIFLFILSTTSGNFSEKQKKNLLKIDEINVVGLTNTENLKIQNELSSIFSKNIFIFRKEEINKIMNKHNIIEEYNIKKVYPSKLNINIKPTKFIAKVTGSNNLMVGANGKLIFNDQNNKTLPDIFGKFNSKYFLEFKENVDRSKFNFTEFKTILFFPSNRWDILTIDDILIKLPQKNISQSLNLAYKIIADEQFKVKNVIDLRIKSHLIIK